MSSMTVRARTDLAGTPTECDSQNGRRSSSPLAGEVKRLPRLLDHAH